jgi:hypothetical protein
MTVSGVVRWLNLAVLALQLMLRLLLGLPRLRKEAREAISAAGLAYREAWEALADRELTREEVAEVRRRLEAFGKETEDVLKLLARVLGLEEEES